MAREHVSERSGHSQIDPERLQKLSGQCHMEPGG
jgi:hypothetical protein